MVEREWMPMHGMRRPRSARRTLGIYSYCSGSSEKKCPWSTQTCAAASWGGQPPQPQPVASRA
eukprot:scaffold46398_cov31-Tisochrysis_lutea.AAC.1